jgi:hypothetical protein
LVATVTSCGPTTTTTSTTTSTTTTTIPPINYRYSYERCDDLNTYIVIVNQQLTIGDVYKFNNGACGTVTGYLGQTVQAANTLVQETGSNSCGDAICPQI